MFDRAEQSYVQKPDISIILVCWNNASYLEECLHSLYESKLTSNFDVIVVDNGSSDGSQQMLGEKFPQVKIIQNMSNLGLGKASNQGIAASEGRYVLLLNNDTKVNGPSLDAMVNFLEEEPSAAAVGGKLLNPDGSIQACYNKFPSLLEEFLIATRLGEMLWKGYPANVSNEQVRSVSWLGSACLMLRRKALDQIGLLDESYFIYGDEVDIQYRLIKAGWKVYYLPQVTTVHYGGRSMDHWRRRKMVNRGKMLFFQKNYGPVRTYLLRSMLLVLSLAKTLVWGIVSISPNWRERSRKEVSSNVDVMKLCWKLE